MGNMKGKTLGNYRIVEELGRGGMAVVYRAFQPSLNRSVAIKVLPAQLALDQQFVERFQREALAAAKLRHPNIVVIHDVGHQEGIYYIVMEHLEGCTLKQLIDREGSLSPDRVVRITEQMAAALDYAHQQGFVHRDIKPANIFVGEDDHVTLTDFGIAKAASETQQLTRTGMLVGTPEYMSPEQAESSNVDYRTDLYALGVVLYQMLVGRVPYQGATPHATLHAVIYEPPPPLRRIKPGIPAPVEEVVLKAIAKQPAQRFRSGAELVAALRSALTGQAARLVVPPQPVVPQKVSAPPMHTRPSSSMPWIVAALAVILLMLLAVLAVLLLSKRKGGETPRPPTAQIVSQNSVISDPADTVLTLTPTATLPSPEETPEGPANTLELTISAGDWATRQALDPATAIRWSRSLKGALSFVTAMVPRVVWPMSLSARATSSCGFLIDRSSCVSGLQGQLMWLPG